MGCTTSHPKTSDPVGLNVKSVGLSSNEDPLQNQVEVSEHNSNQRIEDPVVNQLIEELHF